jgi:ABC-type transporter Mla subunit MlaD
VDIKRLLRDNWHRAALAIIGGLLKPRDRAIAALEEAVQDQQKTISQQREEIASLRSAFALHANKVNEAIAQVQRKADATHSTLFKFAKTIGDEDPRSGHRENLP